MRIDIPENKIFVHESTIPVRWGDMDALGHVNNAVYFRYIEQARINWLDSFGLPVSQNGQGVVVVNAFCNFLKSIEYPAEILVKTYIANPTRTSLETFNLISLTQDPATLYAAGGATMVWVDFGSQRAAKWPLEISARFPTE
jgi:acyl-CoA thioester hydrolase